LKEILDETFFLASCENSNTHMIINTLNNDHYHFSYKIVSRALCIMKKLLVATDFSANAKHAAEYGYLLAKQIKAGVFLCNIITVPAEMPGSGMVVWPMDEGDVLLDDSIEELKRLKAHLEQTDHTETFRPPVDYLNETGTVKEIVNDVSSKQKIDFVIAGTHQPGGLDGFLLGDHTYDLINACIKPLLIIPATAHFAPIKKIAFASDFEHPENDLKEIYELIALAKMLNAEILITHVYNKNMDSLKFEKQIEQFLLEISNKANYPQIYYRILKQNPVESGLEWLCDHGQIDMLAMVHRAHGFFHTLFKGSHTQKMAKKINIPLLVFPENS
jgi:nucleotide-binding universal stress UspA family protein